MPDCPRRAWIGAVVAMTIARPGLSRAQERVTLFRIVGPKDEVVVAVPLPLDQFASRLSSAGQMTVWQYAVRKSADGALQQAPLRKIAVFSHDTLRIEPFSTPLAVVPLPD